MKQTMMTILMAVVALSVSITGAYAQDQGGVEGVMYANKYGAKTNYTIDYNEGFIGFYTKAKVVFYKVDDTREFYVDPGFMNVESWLDFEVGDVFSLDIRTDNPRYTAKLVELAADEAKLEIRDSRKVVDIDMIVDLRGDMIDFVEGVIYLRKAAGTTLKISEP